MLALSSLAFLASGQTVALTTWIFVHHGVEHMDGNSSCLVISSHYNWGFSMTNNANGIQDKKKWNQEHKLKQGSRNLWMPRGFTFFKSKWNLLNSHEFVCSESPGLLFWKSNAPIFPPSLPSGSLLSLWWLLRR